MIFEIELITNTKKQAKLLAKYLVNQHLAALTTITSCDIISLQINEVTVLEQPGVLIKSFTINKHLKTIQSLIENNNISVKSFLYRIPNIDNETEKRIEDWCNLTDLTIQPSKILKQTQQLPRWAEEQGLTLAEYKQKCNENTAAHWNISWTDYNRASYEAKQLGMSITDYLIGKGYTYNPTKPTSNAEEQINSKNKLHMWCIENSLTEHQYNLLVGNTDPKKENIVKPTKWATDLGLNATQYHIVSRIGTAASWGMTLKEYDQLYIEAKSLGKTVEKHLTDKGYTYDKNRNNARQIAKEFIKIYNNVINSDKTITDTSANIDELEQAAFKFKEQQEVENHLIKKQLNLPKWAEEQGLTLAEYERICHENAAKRWGISLEEYEQARKDCLRHFMTVTQYLAYKGYKFNRSLKLQTHEDKEPLPGQLELNMNGELIDKI